MNLLSCPVCVVRVNSAPACVPTQLVTISLEANRQAGESHHGFCMISQWYDWKYTATCDLSIEALKPHESIMWSDWWLYTWRQLPHLLHVRATWCPPHSHVCFFFFFLPLDSDTGCVCSHTTGSSYFWTHSLSEMCVVFLNASWFEACVSNVDFRVQPVPWISGWMFSKSCHISK